MQYIFDTWEKEKNPIELKERVNAHLRFLYMNKEVSKAHEIFDSKWSSYIDLSYKEGSILEFCALLPDYKKTGYPIEELKFLIDKIETQKQNKDLFKQAIHNILLNAVSYNNINMIVYITKEQKISDIDFTYADCAIITNCFPKNNNPTKKEIIKYFIMECNLRNTVEIEAKLKKGKRTDILKVFEKINFYQYLSQKLSDNKSKDKKMKI